MAQEYWFMPLLFGVVEGLVIGTEFGYSDFQSGVIGLLLGLLLTVVWLYSPLPNRSVFEGMGDPKAGFWGFKRGEKDA